MTGRQLLVPEQRCYRAGQRQKPQGVGHSGPGTAHPMGGLLLGEAQLLGQPAVTLGFFHGVQVLPLEVFNQCQSISGVLIHVQHDGRDLVEARQTAGPPAPLAGDDLISIPCFAQGDGGDNTVFPNGLGQLTVNALTACDTVLVPMQCEYYALEGLSQLVSSIRMVKRSSNPKIDIEGIVLTMYDSRTNLTIQVAEEVKKYFGSKVFKTVIPRNVRLSEAPSHGMPVIAYDRLSRGAVAYSAVAEEFLKRGGNR